MTQNIYQTNDYKDYLRAMIDLHGVRSGYQTRLAEAAGCQKSFLSQVLNSHIQLTNDHAAGLCAFWGLNGEETAYFHDLVAYERASSKEFKKFLLQRIKTARDRDSQIASLYHVSEQLSPESLAAYYTSWARAAIHVLVSIPEYSTIESIARRLQLPDERVRKFLEELQQMGLVHHTDKGWQNVQKDLFLPKTSSLTKTYHTIWRHRSIVNMDYDDERSFHFTSLYAISRKDIEKFRQMMLELVESFRQIMPASVEEEMVCVSCDLFHV